MEGKNILTWFEKWYGSRGMKVYFTVMPGIMKDFQGMIEKAQGRPVREEYRLEDGKGTLILSCTNGKDIKVDCIDGLL